MDVKEVVLVGPPGAGKTCLAHALSGLSKAVTPTVGPELYALQRDTQVIHLWDTPGQGQFSSVSAPLLNRASLLLLCSCDGKYSDPGNRAFLKVRTKDDLGAPWFPADLATSSLSGSGVQQLYHAIFSVLEDSPPVADSGCCCCGCSGVSAVATHSKVDQYRLDLLVHP